MADLPMITISIPTYNLGSYLNKTLESILHQTDQNFEIWLVDNASTDKTADTVAQFEQADPRIHAHYFDTHQGVSKARNYAIEHAKGEIIVFVDGDDLLEPNYLEVIATGFTDPTVDLVGVGYTWGWRGGQSGRHDFTEISKTNAYASINHRGGDFGGYTWNKGFKMKIIQDNQLRFDETLDLAEDLLFTAQYTLAAHKILYYPDALYTKVSRSNSIIHSATWEMRSKEQAVRQRIDKMGRSMQP